MTRFYFTPARSKESQNVAKRLRKRSLRENLGFDEKVYYMLNPSCSEKIENFDEKMAHLEQEFTNKVRENDIIEVHADSLPWILGNKNFDELHDYNPIVMATFFERLLGGNRDIQITIDLRSCYSGVVARGPFGDICYAQDLSRALKTHGFHNITVYGYAGSVNSKDPLKQSLSSAEDEYTKGAKVKHCPLVDGRVEYRDGELVRNANKILIDDFEYTKKECSKTDDLSEYLLVRNDWFGEGLSIDQTNFLNFCLDPTLFAAFHEDNDYSPDSSSEESESVSSSLSLSSSSSSSASSSGYLSDSEEKGDSELDFVKTISLMDYAKTVSLMYDLQKQQHPRQASDENITPDYNRPEYRMG